MRVMIVMLAWLIGLSAVGYAIRENHRDLSYVLFGFAALFGIFAFAAFFGYL